MTDHYYTTAEDLKREGFPPKLSGMQMMAGGDAYLCKLLRRVACAALKLAASGMSVAEAISARAVFDTESREYKSLLSVYAFYCTQKIQESRGQYHFYIAAGCFPPPRPVGRRTLVLYPWESVRGPIKMLKRDISSALIECLTGALLAAGYTVLVDYELGYFSTRVPPKTK